MSPAAYCVGDAHLAAFARLIERQRIDDSGRLSVELLRHGELKTCPGYPHGMLIVLADVIDPDLLALVRR